MVNADNLRSLGNNEYLIDIAIKGQNINNTLKDVAVQWISGKLGINNETTLFLQRVLNKEQIRQLIRFLKIRIPMLLHN